MSTQNTVWVVISSQAIADKIREKLDSGSFSAANDITESLKGFNKKIKSLVQQHGGHIYVLLYERIILEIPITLAEQIPDLVSELKSHVGPEVACGIGMDYEEAVKAAQLSGNTGQIEMHGEETEKSDEWAGQKDPFEISPNLFNPEMQTTVNEIPAKSPKKQPVPVVRPEIQQELQTESEYLQAVNQSLGAQPPMPPQQPGQQPGQEPQDLLEALHGGQVPGHKPKDEEDEKSESKEKKDGKKSEKEEKEGGKEEESDKAHSKLADSLLNIRDRIPELITLADKNPEAFKQSMNLIQKLIGLTRSRKKGDDTKKSEVDIINEKLDKMTKALHFPVGTRRGRRIKVIVNGKAVWRSAAAGRVQDSKGQPISVKSHNAAAATGQQEEQ